MCIRDSTCIEGNPDRAGRSEPGAERAQQFDVATTESTECKRDNEYRGADEPSESGVAEAGPASSRAAVDQRRRCCTEGEDVGNTPAAQVSDAGGHPDTDHNRRFQSQ